MKRFYSAEFQVKFKIPEEIFITPSECIQVHPYKKETTYLFRYIVS